MRIDPDPARQKFIRALLADRGATRAQLVAIQRQYWHRQAEAAREVLWKLEEERAVLPSLSVDPAWRARRDHARSWLMVSERRAEG